MKTPPFILLKFVKFSTQLTAELRTMEGSVGGGGEGGADLTQSFRL